MQIQKINLVDNQSLEEKKMALQELNDSAFSSVPVKNIEYMLKENINEWNHLVSGIGKEYFSKEYPSEVIKLSKGDLSNILFVILSFSTDKVSRFEKIRDKADCSEIISLFGTTALVMFFVKKRVFITQKVL